MKNLVRPSLRILAALAMFFTFSAAKPKAPCPYQITNSANCDITVTIDVYSNPGCSTLCSSTPGVVLNAGQVYPIICNCIVCNIVVTVTHIAGAPIAPVPEDFAGGCPSFPPNPCGATGICYSFPTFAIN